MSAGVITSVGIVAMMQAQLSGLAFEPNIIKVSDTLLACDGTETSLPNIVWTAPSSAIQTIANGTNSIRIIINMDATVGDFSIATVGVFTQSDVLFALGAFPAAGQKISYQPPGQAGNIRTFFLDLVYADISNYFPEAVLDISTIALETAVSTALGSVTSRQLQTALSQSGFMTVVIAAVNNLSPSNQASIDWRTNASVKINSPLMVFIANTLSLVDGGASLLAQAALISPP